MTVVFLVRIEYTVPEAVVYKNIKATSYPKFLEEYPEIAKKKGLYVSEKGITVEKQFEEEV